MYNQIDKYLTYILGLKKYVPYHERITMLAGGGHKISRFIQLFEAKLRYFGEMRNQLVHGFRLDQQHYLIVTDYAVGQITQIHDEMITPRTISEMYDQKVPYVEQDKNLGEVLEYMTKNKVKYLPVYKGKAFIGVLSLQDVTARLLKRKHVDISKVTVEEVDTEAFAEYEFIRSDKSIYQLHEYFASDKGIEVILANEEGDIGENIASIVSVHDYVHLQKQYDAQVSIPQNDM